MIQTLGSNGFTVKPVYDGHSQKDRIFVFKTNYRLMQVKRIAESSKGSILIFAFPFLSGRFTQALLYKLVD